MNINTTHAASCIILIVVIEIPEGQNDFIGFAAEDLAQNANNTLYVPLTQDVFDEIVNGKKKVHTRTLKDAIAKRFLVFDEDKPKLNPEVTDPTLDYYLDDLNDGKFPFVPKQFKYINFAVGYARQRDTAIVELEKITFTPSDIRANKFCSWVEEFHISRVVEVHRKK